jgi:hypothetical protein
MTRASPVNRSSFPIPIDLGLRGEPRTESSTSVRCAKAEFRDGWSSQDDACRLVKWAHSKGFVPDLDGVSVLSDILNGVREQLSPPEITRLDAILIEPTASTRGEINKMLSRAAFDVVESESDDSAGALWFYFRVVDPLDIPLNWKQELVALEGTPFEAARKLMRWAESKCFHPDSGENLVKRILLNLPDLMEDRFQDDQLGRGWRPPRLTAGLMRCVTLLRKDELPLDVADH